MRAEIRQGDIRLACCQHRMSPRKWCTQRCWGVNLEQKKHQQQIFRPYLSMWTSQGAGWHWFYYRGALMTSWMSKSADVRERVSDQSLAACPSQALKDAERTMASVMWLPEWGDLWQGQVWEVKHTHTHTQAQHAGKRGKPSCTQADMYYTHSHAYSAYTHHAFSTHLFV